MAPAVDELSNIRPGARESRNRNGSRTGSGSGVHYCAVKTGRGEVFEAADFLAYLRGQVFGPLILLEAGQRPGGVRRLETVAPTRAKQLEATLATHDAQSCFEALKAAVELYRELRATELFRAVELNRRAEQTAVDYVDGLEQRFSS